MAGAFNAPPSGLASSFPNSEDVELKHLKDSALREAVAPDLDQASIRGPNEFRYASREWGVGTPEEHIEWTLNRPTAAVSIWTG